MIISGEVICFHDRVWAVFRDAGRRILVRGLEDEQFVVISAILPFCGHPSQKWNDFGYENNSA